MKKQSYIQILIAVTLLMNSCSDDKTNMLGYDIRLFKGGETWQLAKAVEKEDIEEIHHLIKANKVPVDTREEKFGMTLLIWSINTGHVKSAKALLEEGADPNLFETYSRKSAIMYASDYGPNYDKRTEALKLCLKYGGNPNAVTIGKTSEGYKPRETPLIIASKCCLAKVKLLIDAGANVNFTTENNNNALLSAAELGGNEKAATTEYLLFDKHADFKQAFIVTIDGDTTNFAKVLRHWVYPIGSKEYNIKMKIVKYLQKQGQDYWKTPVPPYYYKNYSKDYLSKY